MASALIYSTSWKCKAGLENPRREINDLHPLNHRSNAQVKLSMNRVLLDVVLPIALVLKLFYESVGDTSLIELSVSLCRTSCALKSGLRIHTARPSKLFSLPPIVVMMYGWCVMGWRHRSFKASILLDIYTE